MPSQIFERRDPRKLRAHPLNQTVYGTLVIDDGFLATIDEETGIIEPLVILPNGTIISGHRRREGAIIKGLESVPCIVRMDLEDKPEEAERLVILSNHQRIRTDEVLVKEATALAKIESALAEQRRRVELKIGPSSPVVVKSATTGKTREKVANELGIGVKKADQAIKVGKAIEEATEKGDKETADKLAKIVKEQSVNAASKILTSQRQKTESTESLNGDDSKDIERQVAALSGAISRAEKALSDLFLAVDRKKNAHPVFAQNRHRKFEKSLRELGESLSDAKTHSSSVALLWADTKKLGMQ